MKIRSAKNTLLAGLLAATSVGANAYEAGDWIVRVGAATVDPDESSSLISVAGGPVAGTALGLDDDTQLGLTVTYMLSNRLGIELLAATPFEHDIPSKGLEPFEVSEVGSVEHLPPTLSAQFYLNDPSAKFQPYVGAGINYTIIMDENLSSEIVNGPIGATDMDIDNSFGLSFQVGFDYALDDNWSINAAVWKIQIDTEAQIDSAVGSIDADLSIDPWVYMISAAYKF